MEEAPLEGQPEEQPEQPEGPGPMLNISKRNMAKYTQWMDLMF